MRKRYSHPVAIPMANYTLNFGDRIGWFVYQPYIFHRFLGSDWQYGWVKVGEPL